MLRWTVIGPDAGPSVRTTRSPSCPASPCSVEARTIGPSMTGSNIDWATVMVSPSERRLSTSNPVNSRSSTWSSRVTVERPPSTTVISRRPSRTAEAARLKPEAFV